MLQSLPLLLGRGNREKGTYSEEHFRYASMFSLGFGKADNYYGILIHTEYSFRFRAVLLQSWYVATSLIT